MPKRGGMAGGRRAASEGDAARTGTRHLAPARPGPTRPARARPARSRQRPPFSKLKTVAEKVYSVILYGTLKTWIGRPPIEPVPRDAMS